MTLLGLAAPLTALFRLHSSKGKANTDTLLSKCVYRSGTSFFLFGCILVSSMSWSQSPIQCHSSTMPSEVLNTFCWSVGTYTIHSKFMRSLPTAPGVPTTFFAAPSTVPELEPILEAGGQITFHAFYPYVVYALFVQAVLFYLPRFMWKQWEGGRTTALVKSVLGKKSYLFCIE
jgi:hypothetical protein